MEFYLGNYIFPYGNTDFIVCFFFFYQDSQGILEFLPGDRLKIINVTIVDNPVPELEKEFRVELYNADGGGEKFRFKS